MFTVIASRFRAVMPRPLAGLAAIGAVLALSAPLAAPAYAATGLTATAVSNHEIDLSWTAVPGGSTLQFIRRCTAPCDIYAAVPDQIAYNLPNPGTYNDTGLVPGTTYRYLVVGWDGYYEADATTGLGLAATVVGYSEVDLAWSHVPDSGPAYLRRCQGAACDIYSAPVIATGLANPGAYTDTGLSSGTTYRYLVVGNDGFYGADAVIPAPPDTTPPVTTASGSPAANSSGWNNSSVTVTLSATDSESSGTGVKQVTYNATGAQPMPATSVAGVSATVVISAEGSTTLGYYATDNAGNAEAARSLLVRIDKTAPALSCVAPDTSWHAGDVSLACTATDGGSGLANPADANFSLSTAAPAGTETANAATGSRTVCDLAGNCATAGPITGIKVDKKAPTITISAPTAGGSYVLGQAVPAAYSCSDGGSGVATCAGSVASGSAIDTAAVGTKTFTVKATDNVGNAAGQSATYTVAYAICPARDRSDDDDGSRAARQATPPVFELGSEVHLRLTLCDAQGRNVSARHIVVTATGLSSGVLPTNRRDEGERQRGYTFGFDDEDGYGYQFSSRGFAAGTYTLTFTAGGDPTVHSLQFVLRQHGRHGDRR